MLSPKELDLRVVVAIRCRSKTVLVTFRCGNVSSLKQLYEHSAILKVCAKWREDFWFFSGIGSICLFICPHVQINITGQ